MVTMEEEYTLEQINEQIKNWTEKSVNGSPIAIKLLAKWKQREKEYLTTRQQIEKSNFAKTIQATNRGYGKVICLRIDDDINKMYDEYLDYQKLFIDKRINRLTDRSKTFRRAIKEWLENQIKTKVEPFNEKLKQDIMSSKRGFL